MKPLYDTFDPYIAGEQEVTLISHYDLDAVGATYFAKKIFNVAKAYASGYPKVLNNIKNGREYSNICVFVDLSMPVAELEIALDLYDIVYVCDHHLTSETFSKFLDSHPNKFFFLFDHDYSATGLLAHKFASEVGKLSFAERNFAYAVDRYDMWDSKTRAFEVGYHLNYMFWKKNFWGFEHLLKPLKDSDNLVHSIDPQLWNDSIKEREVIREYVLNEGNYDEMVMGDIKARFYVFPKHCFYANDVLLMVPTDECNFLIAQEAGKETMSIRSKLEDANVNDLLKKSNSSFVVSGGGHKKAGGFTHTCKSDEDYGTMLTTIIEDVNSQLEGQFI